MWTAIKLGDGDNCKKVCEAIQRHIIQKANRDNIDLSGKIIHISIQDTIDPLEIVASIESKNVNITES